MFNLQEQRDFIISAGEMVVDHGPNEKIYLSDFDYISENWNLSEDLCKFVGPDGRVSFPMRFENKILLDSRDHLSDVMSNIGFSLHKIFRLYAQPDKYVSELDCTEAETISEISKKLDSIRVLGIDVSYKGNKVVVKKDTSYSRIITADGEEIELKQRKSAMKTLEKLAIDVFTKDLYPLISETNHFKDYWAKLTSEVRELQDIVSKNISSDGTLYLSALPEDILTASINNYNWKSCFKHTGEYNNIPFEYLRNENTMIAFYIPNDAKNKKFNYAGLEVYNKPWRMLVYLTRKGNLALSDEQYPTTSRELRDNVAGILSKAYSGDFYPSIGTDRDGGGYFDGAGSYINFDTEYNEENIQDISGMDSISDDKSVCTIGGHYIGHQSGEVQSFRDYSEIEMYYCEDCSEYYSDGCVVHITLNGEHHSVCDYCLESNYQTCHFTEEYLSNYQVDSRVIVMENCGSGEDVVFASVEAADELVYSGEYIRANFTVSGLRWDDVYNTSGEILVKKDIGLIRPEMIRVAANRLGRDMDVLAFAINDIDSGESIFEKGEFVYIGGMWGYTLFNSAEEIIEFEITNSAS